MSPAEEEPVEEPTEDITDDEEVLVDPVDSLLPPVVGTIGDTLDNGYYRVELNMDYVVCYDSSLSPSVYVSALIENIANDQASYIGPASFRM